MRGSMKLTLALVPLMALTVSGCVSSATSTATDRLKPLAAAHAGALAGDDMAAARTTGRALLASLAALGDW